MDDLFEQDAAALKEKLLLMAGRAEDMVRRAMRGMLLRESGLARGIKTADSEVDRFEKEIDEAAVGLLAKATRPLDLRLLVVAMKISPAGRRNWPARCRRNRRWICSGCRSWRWGC